MNTSSFRTVTLIAVACTALTAAAATAMPDYPSTRRTEQVDGYFGTQVADPYRWLEDDNAPETAAWVEAQNRLTSDWLARIPFRAAVLARVRTLTDYPKTGGAFEKAGKVYFYANDGLQNQSPLYVQEGVAGTPTVLIDPNTFSPDGTIRLTSFEPSRDGRYAVYGRTAIPGSDWQEFRVMDLTTRQTLPEVIRWTKFTRPAWSGHGFYYSRLPQPAPGTEMTARLLNQTVWYHRVGTPQTADTLVFEDREHPTWMVDLTTTPDERVESLYRQDPAHKGSLLSVREQKQPGQAKRDLAFVPIVAEVGEPTYTVLDHLGRQLLVMTNRSAPNGRVVRIDPAHPAEAAWTSVLPERPEALQRVSIGGGRLFAHYLKDVASRIEIYSPTGRRLGQIALPAASDASVTDADATSREVFYTATSLNLPPTLARYDLASGRSTPFRPVQVPGFDPTRYETTQVFFASKDGTRIPMFLVHRKGLVMDGRRPTLLYGYGGFNITLGPSFNPGRIAWLEQGGVYAQVNLRGGGEYGEAWHEAGTKLQKQNVFDDCIAAAEYLIREGVTSPAFLALQGGSNGGLLVGAVVNQRPDLFRVALPQVGVMDMLRFQRFSAGASWVSDYGSSDDPAEFQALRRYSPLHNVRRDVPYPAMLVSTADHDDRVVPAHSFKYAATLQAEAGRDAPTAGGPTLIRIATRSGHGASNLQKRLEEQADLYSFVWFNMGVTPSYAGDADCLSSGNSAGTACPPAPAGH